MTDEITPPRLRGPTPVVENVSETFDRLRKRARRQRARAASVFSNSSDQAIFSSDDDPSSIDNYTEGRPKKRYLGSWFQRARNVASDKAPASPRTRRPFTRHNADSGIYMGSDEDEDDDVIEDQLPLPKPRTVALPFAPRILYRQHDMAGRRVRACVDAGDERVDLSSMELSTISRETLQPLVEFSTTIPTIARDVPFEQRDPEIELYLSTNSLRALPRALFEIDHLTTLSLRNNQLTELPPAIGQLRNLRSLNIAQNSLRFLPSELLDLVANVRTAGLLHFHAHPNPFLQPVVEHSPELGFGEVMVPARSFDSGGPEAKPTVLHPAFFWARSLVQMSDVYGTIYTKFRLDDCHSPVPVASGKEEGALKGSRQRQYLCGPVSRVPSLADIALRTCYNSPSLQHMPSMLNDYPHLGNLVTSLISHREAGEASCASCGRIIGVPKIRWLEWWALTKMQPRELSPQPADAERPTTRVWRQTLLNSDPDEMFMPFLRQGCSWKCMPQEMAQGSWYHETR